MKAECIGLFQTGAVSEAVRRTPSGSEPQDDVAQVQLSVSQPSHRPGPLGVRCMRCRKGRGPAPR